MNIKEVYKWAYALEKDYKLLKKENSQLKEKINTSQTSRLIAENNRLNEICRYWENEHDVLAEENEILNNKNEKLKQQNTQIKHKNNQQAKTIERLIKIITDEHYN